MMHLDAPETTAEERYHDRIRVWTDARLPRWMHHAWWVLHNCVAHPLIGVAPNPLTFALHDYTSRKLLPETSNNYTPPPPYDPLWTPLAVEPEENARVIDLGQVRAAAAPVEDEDEILEAEIIPDEPEPETKVVASPAELLRDVVMYVNDHEPVADVALRRAFTSTEHHAIDNAIKEALSKGKLERDEFSGKLWGANV